MSLPPLNRNPFDLVKASDFSDEQIKSYWVDLVGEASLLDLLKPRLEMPMLLLGSKGSGKTHLMRYYSASVRKRSFDGNLHAAMREDKYLGIYVRADGLNVSRFSAKGQKDETWGSVFAYYFELWLATHLLRTVQEALNNASSTIDEESLVTTVLALFSKPINLPINTLDALISHFVSLRKEIDHVVSNVATGSRHLAEIEVCISPGDLAFGIPEKLLSISGNFEDVLFVYMIDEIENFSATQQRFLNSLIRYKRGPVSIKVGTRLYGLRTKKTLGDPAEEIRPGAEYEEVRLDEWLRDNSDGYHVLAKNLINKRLQQPSSSSGINTPIEEFFEVIDSRDHYKKVTLELVSRYDKAAHNRPYFTLLRQHLLEYGGINLVADSNDIVDNIINLLRVPSYPILEKTNVYLLYKSWGTVATLTKKAEEIGEASELFLSKGKKGSKSYFETLDHFKSDFLAQLYRDCEKHRVPYAGFDTLVHLSQGVPRNLLGLLKQIYRRSHFSGERPFTPSSKISIASQVDGIRDAAAWFWDDAQPDSHGPEARQAVQSLAEFFSSVRFSLKPAECDLATFTVAARSGSEHARKVLNHAENWSYLIRIRAGGSDRNDPSAVDEKYQLSPMLAPRWEVSEHRRGAISLNPELFNAIFDTEIPSDHAEMIKRDRLKGMREPYRSARHSDAHQDALF
jgi:hypothetical protein